MSELREALSAVFEQSEGGEEAAPVSAPVETSAPEPVAAPLETTPATPESETAAEAAARIRDEKGRFAPKAADAKPGEPTATATPPTVAPTATTPPVPATPTATPTPELRAPQSWKPEVREEWAKVPPAVQREVVRREKEAASALQSSSESRKFHESFQQAVSPYAAMIQAEGSDPVKAAASLFNTAYVLRSAPPQQKAQLLAKLVQDYAIPIDALAAALDGQAQPQQAQPSMRDPRVDKILEIQQQQRAMRAQQTHSHLAQEVETFAATAEFFNDVREEMALVAESNVKRGVEMSLADVYSRAVQLNPETSKVLQQRAAAAAVNASASTQRARDASSSIRSQPTLAGGQAQGDDIRSTLEASITALSGR